LQAILKQAAQQFGADEPRTVWLAVLAVLAHAPAPMASSDALAAARSLLQAREPARAPQDRGASVARADDARGLRFVADLAATPPGIRSAGDAAPAPQRANSREAAAPNPAEVMALLGEPTAGAGLYFLLQALRHLGLPAALAADPQLLEARFVAHLLKRLALHAKVALDDPILRCIDAETLEPFPDVLPADARVWPRGWPQRRGDGRALLRIWSVAVRRWCCRNAGITVREIVRRGGRVWLTRSDLDVTLPLAALDVRIRRVGLDIDPGWLPWFGRYGRVVRFHYRDRPAPEAAG
jgi:hypothetical protein